MISRAFTLTSTLFLIGLLSLVSPLSRAATASLTTQVLLPLVHQLSTTQATQAVTFRPGFPNADPKIITFASPSIVDINGDGRLDILTGDGAGCVWGWDLNGQRLSGFPWQTVSTCSQSARIGPPLAIGDVDGDGKPEVVAGTRGTGTLLGQRGRVYVWHADGTLLPNWPKEMDWNPTGNGGAEVYGVALANVAGDARLEILAGTSNNSTDQALNNPGNLYAWHADGTLLPGYPTVPTSTATAGIFGMIGAADLDGDGYAEVVTGRDHAYVYATGATGQSLPGWPVRTYVDPAKANYNTDRYIEFTHNPPSMGDIDGDGTVETVIAGKVRDPAANRATTQSAVLVLEPNGQRRAGWIIPPLGGAPLYDDNLPSQAPALADLDGDGKLEIVVALFDGTIRAYRENGTQLWKYNYAQGSTLFASEPVIGDVTGDGKLDIIFGTYSPNGSANAAARVLGLDTQGQPLPMFPLTLGAEGTSDKQGVRAAPTLADIDGNGAVELFAGSQAGVIYAWNFPAAYRADLMPWPTSRHDNLRSGATPRKSVVTSATPTVTPATPTTPTVTPATPATPTTTGSTLVKNITFENNAGKLTDSTTGTDTIVGSVALERSAPLKGAYSARISDTKSAYLQEEFAAANSLSVSFYLRVISVPITTRIMIVRNGDKTIGNLQLTSDRRLYLRNYETRIGASSAPLTLGAIYHVAIYQQRGTGSNAVLSAYLARDDTAFDSPFATNTTQSFTSQATSIRIGATNSRTTNIVVDDIVIDNASKASSASAAVEAGSIEPDIAVPVPADVATTTPTTIP